MSERLALFWFRYKYAVVAVLVCATAATGFLTSGGDQGPEIVSQSNETIVQTAGVETLITRSDGLEPCLQGDAMSNPDRRACLEEVPYGPAPLVLLDGDRDAAVLANGSELAGTGLSFTDALPEEVRSLVQHGVAVDLDNDGSEEILLALSRPPAGSTAPVLVIASYSDGFRDATEEFLPEGLGAIDDPWSVEPVDGFAPGDWNGDGWVDVIAYRNSGGADRGAILLVNGGMRAPGALRVVNTGSYPSGDDYTMFRGAMRNLFDSVQGFNSGSGFEKVTTGDVNDDGWVDAVFLTSIGVVGVVRGGVDFYPLTDVYEIPGGAADVLVADFDGDQRDDMAVALQGTTGLEGSLCSAGRPCDLARGFPNGGVLFLAGRDEGEFEREPAWDLVATGPVDALAAVDIDNDGALELIVGGQNLRVEGKSKLSGGAVGVFGFSQGSFTERDLGGISVTSAERIFAGDFNGDGTRDIVTYGRSSDAVQLVTFPTSVNDHLRVIANGSASVFTEGSNDSAIGAVVSVTEGTRTFTFTVGAGGLSLPHSSLAVHLGLGTTDGAIDLATVEFPLTGRRLAFTNVPVNTVLAAREPTS